VGDAFQIVSFLSPNHIAERWQQWALIGCFEAS
jgi:hypothetical protein